MKFHAVIAGAFVVLAATACGAATQITPAADATPASSVSHTAPASKSSPVPVATRHTTTPAPSGAATPAPSESATAQAAKPVVFLCSNQSVAEPGTYVLTCADDGSLLVHLSWESWTAEQGTATGINKLNDCTPNCAEGKFRDYPASITFWRPVPLVGRPGETYFSRITVRYTTAARPPAYMSYGQLLHNPAEWSQVLST
jgi:hypothetical protein